MTELPVVVIGAGPAGLAAALALRELGVTQVITLDRESIAGGVPRHSDHTGYGLKDLRRLLTGPKYAAALRDGAVQAGVDLRTTATVTGWDEQLRIAVTSRQGRYVIEAAAIVLATGCRERPRSARLVPGDRPAGIMTTGQLQQLVHLQHQPAGRDAIIVGAEHVSYSAAMTLAAGGCHIVAMVTERPRHTSFRALDAAARLRYRFPLLTNASVSDIRGGDRVKQVEITHPLTGSRQLLDCDTVVFTGDWIADHELASRHGLPIDRASTGVMVDSGLRTQAAGVFAAGNVIHPAETADVCTSDGRHVARSVVGWLQSRSWPTHAVTVHAESPLRWVTPQQISDHSSPVGGHFVLRADAFSRAPRLVVAQGQRELWHGRVPWLVPDRPVYLPSRWVSDVDLGHHAPAVRISAR